MTVPSKDLAEPINAEAQSRLRLKLAKDKLLLYGLTEVEIKNIPSEQGESRARFTLRSPLDGRVAEVVAEPGDLYNALGVLLTIEGTSPTKPTHP